jgi:hypothetical protein
MPEPLGLRVAVGVGAVAGCTLALQVMLTRLFSAALFYHFAFFAISLALLGTGAGAILVYLWPRRFGAHDAQAALARFAMAFAALVLVVPALLVRLDYRYHGFEVTLGFAGTLAAAAVLGALPFLAAGIAIALAIRAYVADVGRLYAFDLVGAGLGAVAVVPLLWLVDAPTLCVGLGVVGAVAAALFAGPRRPERRAALALVALGVVLAGLSATTRLTHLPATFEPGRAVAADRWTPVSRVVGYSGGPASAAVVTYDQDLAPVPLRAPGGRLPDWRALGLGPQRIAFELGGGGRALIVGGGGGRDIYNALTAGARRVDVIELNRAIREVVDEDLRPWSGSPYSLPGVSVAIGDGRSTLAARDTRYDAINIGFTNTLSASAGHAYALAENNLYTVEAFREYLDHLRPRGVLSVSRLYRFAGEEALRATVLALEALDREGAREPRRHVMVLRGRDALNAVFGTVMARRAPLTDAEAARVRALARKRDAEVVFGPGEASRREWRGLDRAPSVDAFCSGYRLDVCPPTDDRPFFLNSVRLGDLGRSLPEGSTFITRTPFVVLLVALGVLAALSALAFVVPLLARPGPARPPAGALAFFAAIGLGFLLLEVVLIQRFVLFLGFPTYALSVVLFALLVFTGAGSYLSAGRADPRRALVASLAAGCALIAAAALALPALLHALIGAPFALRVAITVALLAPVGLSLGMAMPIGLRRLAAQHPSGVPWAWGINGSCSVLAAVLGIFIALVAGFTVTTLVALACYVAALVHALAGRWPSAAPAPPPPVEGHEATLG